jgi:hypothetical protein
MNPEIGRPGSIYNGGSGDVEAYRRLMAQAEASRGFSLPWGADGRLIEETGGPDSVLPAPVAADYAEPGNSVVSAGVRPSGAVDVPAPAAPPRQYPADTRTEYPPALANQRQRFAAGRLLSRSAVGPLIEDDEWRSRRPARVVVVLGGGSLTSPYRFMPPLET